MDATRNNSDAAPEEVIELRSLMDVVLASDTEKMRQDAMTAALADPDAALASFRLLAPKFPDRYARAREADERRCCTDCAHLSKQDHRCIAAWRGERIGNAGRNYHPVIDLPGRCEHFAPRADEDDQRSGADRWPGMVADNQRLRELGKNG